MEREVLSSSPWDPGTGLVGIAKLHPSGEVCASCEETFLYRESGQTLEQAYWRDGQCPIPVSI